MEQPQLTTEPPPEGPKPPAMSLWGRLLNVFATPGDVFEEVKGAPEATANWLVPALILIVVSWAAAALIFSQPAIKQQLSDLTEQAIQRQIDSAHLSEQQADQARAMGEKWAGISAQIGAALFPVLVGFILPFLWGLFVWLLGTQLLKGHFSYMKAVEVVGLCNMILVLETIVKTLLIVGLGNLYASPGLVLLVNQFDPQNTLHKVLAAVNVMTFWVLAVRGIGLARLSGASLAKSIVWVIAIWAAYTGLFIGIGALLQAGVKQITG
jgi:VIT1/CCC1 family predicted Fe2+/Mn2+ transporter